MGFFFANALHYVCQIRLSVLRYSWKRFDARLCLWLMLHVQIRRVLPTSPFPRKVTEQISALPHIISLQVLFGQRAVNSGWALARKVVYRVGNFANVVNDLLLISTLQLRLTERVALELIGRRRRVLVRMLRANHCVGRVDLTVAFLRWSLDYCLRTQTFRLNVSVAAF